MTEDVLNPKKYYGAQGNYLKEHKKYFSKERLQTEINFLIDVLNLNKKDKILDLACGHGRHTIELKKRGFDVDGLDFSDHLLVIAREHARRENLRISFYEQDIHRMNLKIKYNKIFLLFSEFGLFDAAVALKNMAKVLRTDGLFLLDCDNVFRLIQYLLKHPKSPYHFDFSKMELRGKGNNSQAVRYYIVPELEVLLQNAGLQVTSVYSSYQKEKLNINSKRIIIVAKNRS